MSMVQARPRITTGTRSGTARDTGIDFVRALCVVGVVVLHALMVGVTVTGAGPVFENASEGSGWITPLSWILQVMPLFFVIGGFSGLLAYRRLRASGGSATGFIAARVHRLLRPALLTIGVVGVLLVALAVMGVPAGLLEIAGYRFGQPLWFLGVFLLCQALLPALAAAHDRAPVSSMAVLVAAAVAVDAVRAATGFEGIGFLNLAFVWMALQQLGFFFADGSIDRLPRRVRAIAGAAAVCGLILTWMGGIYSPDLIANINPPTAALLLVGVAHTAGLSLLRERLRRVSRGPRIAAFTDFVTRRTMTIYLWHMPILLAMAGTAAAFSLATGIALPALSGPEWWLSRPLWLVTVLALTAVVATVLSRVENAPAPAATRSRGRVAVAVLAGLVAVVLLLVVGTTPLTASVSVVLGVAALRVAHPRPATDVRPVSPVRPAAAGWSAASRVLSVAHR